MIPYSDCVWAKLRMTCYCSSWLNKKVVLHGMVKRDNFKIKGLSDSRTAFKQFTLF